ncbi:MAG TPA: nucleotidyltransferase family protein [Bacteroidales bacterium]|nr:nucleotidyltransferase family protein [Bacteroidales bacterium]
MKAMIFAAGLGTRLAPFTQTIPKAMVPVAGKPMIEWVIRKLIAAGFNEIIINVHHFADQVIDFVTSKHHFGIRIEFSNETGQLLETGGGLLKASWFFDDNRPFLVHNVDVISDIDLSKLTTYHTHSKALATLVVSNRETSRYFLFSNNMLLRGWKNVKTGEQIIAAGTHDAIQPWAFNGIHMINTEVFALMTETGRFPINDVYLRLCNSHQIKGFPHNGNVWFDLGKTNDLQKASEYIEQTESQNF